MKNYKSIICVAAAVCLLGTAVFCGFPYLPSLLGSCRNRTIELYGSTVDSDHITDFRVQLINWVNPEIFADLVG